MSQDYIEPTFTTEARRLQFLGRLWGARTGNRTFSAQDVAAWQSFKATKPTPGQQNYHALLESWREQRVANVMFFVMSKWDSYKLGKVRPAAASWLVGKPTPNQSQSREAVRLQLLDKYAAEVAGLDITTLTSLVSGLVW